MKFHHYLEAKKLRENSRDLLKTRGKLGSQFWGGGLYSGFWLEYLPLHGMHGYFCMF